MIMLAILQRKSSLDEEERGPVCDVWSLNVEINRGEELPTSLKILCVEKHAERMKAKLFNYFHHI